MSEKERQLLQYRYHKDLIIKIKQRRLRAITLQGAIEKIVENFIAPNIF